MLPTSAAIKVYLTRPLRVAIMLSLIALFFVGSPLLIMYTAGYRYDWTEHMIKSTGVISVDVLPTDVQVSLNGVVQKSGMPLRLTDRAPGTYHISMEKPGFRSWNSDVTVLSNQTYYLKNVQLFKDTEPRLVKGENIIAAYATKNPGMILTVSKLPDNYVVEYRSTNEASGIIIATSSLEHLPIISVAPTQDQALISTTQTDHTTVTVVDFSSPSNAPAFTYNTTSTLAFQWSQPTAGANVYVQSPDKIELISANQSQRFFANTTSSVWFVDTNNVLWTATEKTITRNIAPLISYATDRAPLHILDINNSRILTRTENGFMVIPRSGERATFIPATASFYHTGTHEWWLTSDWELWSVYDNGNTTLLNRSANRIRDVRPLDQFGVALIMSDHELVGFNPGYYVSQTLANVEAKNIETDWVNRTIYFLDTATTSSLYALDY